MDPNTQTQRNQLNTGVLLVATKRLLLIEVQNENTNTNTDMDTNTQTQSNQLKAGVCWLLQNTSYSSKRLLLFEFNKLHNDLSHIASSLAPQ